MGFKQIDILLVLSGAKFPFETSLLNRLRQYFGIAKVHQFLTPKDAYNFLTSLGDKKMHFSHVVCVYNEFFDAEIGTIFDFGIHSQKILVVDSRKRPLDHDINLHDDIMFLEDFADINFYEIWAEVFGEQPKDQLPPEVLVQEYIAHHPEVM